MNASPFKKIINWILLEWDASLSVLSAVLFWTLVTFSGRQLQPAQPLFASLVALGVAVGLGAFVAGRWVSDRLAKDEYGAVIVAFDPDESRTQRPYFIMAIAGLTACLFGVVMMVASPELPLRVASVLYSVAFGLAIYCVLGSMSLVVVSRRHQRRASVLRALKEDDEREKRRRDQERPG